MKIRREPCLRVDAPKSYEELSLTKLAPASLCEAMDQGSSREKRIPLHSLGRSHPSGRIGTGLTKGIACVAAEPNEQEGEAAEWEAGRLGLTKSHAILQRCHLTRNQVSFMLDQPCTTLYALSSILIMLRSMADCQCHP